jgi:hypothetical protein
LQIEQHGRLDRARQFQFLDKKRASIIMKVYLRVGEALTKDKKSKAGCFKFCASLEVILKEYLVGYSVVYGEVWSKWRGGIIWWHKIVSINGLQQSWRSVSI